MPERWIGPNLPGRTPRTLLVRMEMWLARFWAEALYDQRSLDVLGSRRALAVIRSILETGRAIQFVEARK